MNAMTISQLLHLTKTEILELRRHLQEQLPHLAEGSPERHATSETLDNIEIVLRRPEFRHGRNGAAEPAQ